MRSRIALNLIIMVAPVSASWFNLLRQSFPDVERELIAIRTELEEAYTVFCLTTSLGSSLMIASVIRLKDVLNWFYNRRPSQTGWSANAYLTDDCFVIHSCSRTYNNRGWYNQPVFRLSIDSDASEVGNRLRAALESSVWDSRIDDSNVVPHPFVVAAGFESWSALEKCSRLVNIATDKKSISMTPCRAAKRSEGQGFVAIDGTTVQIPWTSNDADVGNSLLSVFERATGKAGT